MIKIALKALLEYVHYKRPETMSAEMKSALEALGHILIASTKAYHAVFERALEAWNDDKSDASSKVKTLCGPFILCIMIPVRSCLNA